MEHNRARAAHVQCGVPTTGGDVQREMNALGARAATLLALTAYKGQAVPLSPGLALHVERGPVGLLRVRRQHLDNVTSVTVKKARRRDWREGTREKKEIQPAYQTKPHQYPRAHSSLCFRRCCESTSPLSPLAPPVRCSFSP